MASVILIGHAQKGQDIPIYKIIVEVLRLLTKRELRNMALLMGMIFVMAAFDAIGVASILPFIALIADPRIIETNPVMGYAFGMASRVGVSSEQEFMILLGFLVLLLLLSSLAFRALTAYAQIRFALLREYTIGSRLLRSYLGQSYIWFVCRNSSDLSKNILSEVASVIGNGLIPIMNIMAQGTITLFLVILLVIVDPYLALSLGFLIGFSYLTTYLLMSATLKRHGQMRSDANRGRFIAIAEAFGSPKELKLRNLEMTHLNRFNQHARIYAQGETASRTIQQIPRFVFEAIVFGAILTAALYLMSDHDRAFTAQPVIALYAVAGYRLLPGLQQIYAALTQLRFVEASLLYLKKDLATLAPETPLVLRGNTPIFPKKEISLEGVSYFYPGSQQPALININITVPAGDTVGIVGTTGSGKTTVLDLLLALLEPDYGKLRVDGIEVNESNRHAWQNSVGYVPQNIYLSDDTVAANIAFGVEAGEIDIKRVEKVGRIAKIHSFICGDLPNGYQTVVGERGVRLSGGQRQRIGLARALYADPKVLILDEATSALDSLTEQAVMDSVSALRQDLTIILVAHRLSTVRDCDKIYLLEGGRVIDVGRYDELCTRNEKFSTMASRRG